LGYKMKAYQNIFSAGCLVVLMLGTALAGTSSSSACKTGHYRADFNTLKIAQLKPLNIQLLLPINVEIEFFKGKYRGQTIERNEAKIYLHTLYGGCLVEWQRYFVLDVQVFDKQNYDAELDRKTYYEDPCQNFKKVAYDDFKDYDKYKIGDINYYTSSDRIFFKRYFQLDDNTFVMATADFNKRLDKKANYSRDISGAIDILKSIQFAK